MQGYRFGQYQRGVTVFALIGVSIASERNHIACYFYNSMQIILVFADACNDYTSFLQRLGGTLYQGNLVSVAHYERQHAVSFYGGLDASSLCEHVEEKVVPDNPFFMFNPFLHP